MNSNPPGRRTRATSESRHRASRAQAEVEHHCIEGLGSAPPDLVRGTGGYRERCANGNRLKSSSSDLSIRNTLHEVAIANDDSASSHLSEADECHRSISLFG